MVLPNTSQIISINRHFDDFIPLYLDYDYKHPQILATYRY